MNDTQWENVNIDNYSNFTTGAVWIFAVKSAAFPKKKMMIIHINSPESGTII